ncbi:hypothetical protein T484DRAFT_1795857 [Baffinella frigidus]|nr:hypothetical protein T484DRAFT_1795857 [Cryptophyta sp. CCMP2293]
MHNAPDASSLIPSNAPEAIALIISSPVAVKVLSGLTLLLYVLGQVVPGTESVLAMKATNTYGSHSYVWNVFTASFFNTSLIMAILVVFTFIVMGRFLIPPWTSTEMSSP